MTTASQRSSQLKAAFPREKNGLGTLQSGQEEDFSKTTNHLLNSNSLTSALINSNQKLICNSSSSVNSLLSNPPVSESKDLYYNRFIKQNAPSPPIKLSSFSPTKLKANQIPGFITPATSATSSASIQSNSFQITTNWNPNSYLSHTPSQTADHPDNNKSSDLSKNPLYQQQQQQQMNRIQNSSKLSKYGSTSVNTPPVSPTSFKSLLPVTNNEIEFKQKSDNQNILDESNDMRTIDECVSKLNSARIRPLRHQTKHIVVSVQNLLDLSRIFENKHLFR